MPTFTCKREYDRAKRTMVFYQGFALPLRFSRFLYLANPKRQEISEMIKKQRWVTILAYVFMPNHFHFLLRQEKDGGISKFMSNFQNSYTRFFNTRKQRLGGLFLGQFKAVRIESEGQLYHVSRYIHLNPYTGYVVKTISELKKYPWSSFREYLGLEDEHICDKELVLGHFPDGQEYEQFVLNRADYQRSLQEIKHLLCE